MKQLIEIKPGALPDEEHIYLPQIRTKSMSIPSLKMHNNVPSRMLQVKQPRRDRYNSQAKGIINLDQIQKKGKLENLCKFGPANQRKIISLQHQPIDLWKQKYEPNYISQPKKLNKMKSQVQMNLDRKSPSLSPPPPPQKPKLLSIKKSQKNNFMEIKMNLKLVREKSIPDEFHVQRLEKHVKIRRDTKLQLIQKQIKIENRQIIKNSQSKHETIEQSVDDNINHQKVTNDTTNNHRKHYKSLLPTFQKINSRVLALSKQKQDLDSPTKWEIQHHYFEEQDQF